MQITKKAKLTKIVGGNPRSDRPKVWSKNDPKLRDIYPMSYMRIFFSTNSLYSMQITKKAKLTKIDSGNPRSDVPFCEVLSL